jgi:hypothetical protein
VTASSAITRCRHNLRRDRDARTVRLDDNDAFCLGGTPLVLVNGTNGQEGAEYRTEPDTFTKIVAHRSSGESLGQPTSFEVFSKDGRIVSLSFQSRQIEWHLRWNELVLVDRVGDAAPDLERLRPRQRVELGAQRLDVLRREANRGDDLVGPTLGGDHPLVADVRQIVLLRAVHRRSTDERRAACPETGRCRSTPGR